MSGFYYILFGEEEGGEFRDRLDGYPHLKHLIYLWQGIGSNGWGKCIKRLVRIIVLINLEERNG